MSFPLISIVVATYNGERFLRKQLDSILAQSYNNIELIIGDDNSSDNTIDILNAYAKHYPVKIILNEENIGYVKNFERLLFYCSGDYIAFCDQDDIWLPNKLEILFNAIESYECVHSDAFLIDENDDIISDSFSSSTHKICLPNRLIDLGFNGCVTGCTMLVKRSLIAEILPFPQGLDVHDRWIGALSFSRNSLAYMDVPLIKYRQHGENTIGAFDVKQSSHEIIVKWLKENYRNIFSVNKKFLDECRQQSNFIDLFSKKFKDHLTDEELNDLRLAKDLFGRLSMKNCRLQDVYLFIKLLPYFNINKPFHYKFLYSLSMIRNMFILLIKSVLRQ